MPLLKKTIHSSNMPKSNKLLKIFNIHENIFFFLFNDFNSQKRTLSVLWLCTLYQYQLVPRDGTDCACASVYCVCNDSKRTGDPGVCGYKGALRCTFQHSIRQLSSCHSL